MNLLKIKFEIPYGGEKLSKAEVDQLQATIFHAVNSTMMRSQKIGNVVEFNMEIGHMDDEIPEARRFGERLMKHGLTLEQASRLSLRYVPQEPYKGEPEKAADAFFSEHGHKSTGN
ncbi:MAG: hypothetical protein K2X55_07575 [Burkholderiaceae bacterium]|nr:hypothetical protein [Burkholderiaceae bacterium]